MLPCRPPVTPGRAEKGKGTRPSSQRTPVSGAGRVSVWVRRGPPVRAAEKCADAGWEVPWGLTEGWPRESPAAERGLWGLGPLTRAWGWTWGWEAAQGDEILWIREEGKGAYCHISGSSPCNGIAVCLVFRFFYVVQPYTWEDVPSAPCPISRNVEGSLSQFIFSLFYTNEPGFSGAWFATGSLRLRAERCKDPRHERDRAFAGPAEEGRETLPHLTGGRGGSCHSAGSCGHRICKLRRRGHSTNHRLLGGE